MFDDNTKEREGDIEENNLTNSDTDEKSDDEEIPVYFQVNKDLHRAEAAVQAAVELDGEVDAAELAAVILDGDELVRRKLARIETLYRPACGPHEWYSCLTCQAGGGREPRH